MQGQLTLLFWLACFSYFARPDAPTKDPPIWPETEKSMCSEDDDDPEVSASVKSPPDALMNTSLL